MKPSEAKVLEGLRKTTLAYLSDKQYAEVVEAVEKQGILGLTGAASRLVKGAVVKHGSHDQKTHGRKGGGGGGGDGGSSESAGTIGIGGANEKEELAGLADRAENDTQSLANEAEDLETELLNSGLGVNSPDVRTARSMRGDLRDAKDIFEGSKKIKDLGEKRKKLTSGYKKLERAFGASSGSDINSVDDISEGISMVMADLEQGLGLDARD